MSPEDKQAFIEHYGINVGTTNDEYKAIYEKEVGGI